MSEAEFSDLVGEIRRQGFDEATAARYAALIGDNPVFSGDGNVIVHEDGREVARLDLLVFFSEERCILSRIVWED